MRVTYIFQSTDTRFSEPSAIQVHTFQQIHGLQKRGHTVNLLALHGRKVYATQDINAIKLGKSGDNLFCNLGITNSFFYKLAESIIRRTQRVLKIPYFALIDSHKIFDACTQCARNTNIIHERYNLLSCGGALFKKTYNIPFVLEVNADIIDEMEAQGKPLSGIQKHWAVWTTKFCFESADQIICVSENLRDHLIKKWDVLPGKISVLPNAADTDLFSKIINPTETKNKYALNDEPIVMFIGGFYLWHDLPLLVECIEMILQKFPKIKLFLVGDGNTKKDIVELINSKDLNDSVILTGKIEHQRIPELLSIADIAVAPNIAFFKGHGGSPLKIFEYMAAGKAIIATKTGQLTTIIRNGETGYLIDPGDKDHFAEKIDFLLTNPDERKRLGRNAQREAILNYSWDHYAKTLEEIYASCIS